MFSIRAPQEVDDLAKGKYTSRVRSDFMGGTHTGVNGTHVLH